MLLNFRIISVVVNNTNEEFQYQNSVPPVINVSETIAEEAVLLRDKLQDVDASNVVGASFSDALCDSVSQTAGVIATTVADDLKIGENVPERWSEYHLWSATPDGFIADAGVISSFKKTMLDRFGIDVDNRIAPSYEITAEQQEWLASRYDLSALENAEVSSIEHNNFLLDLV